MVWVFLTGLLLAIFAWWPMVAAYPQTQGGDGPVFHKMLEASRISILRYHELPLWQPYECGGIPLWDNPQGPAAAPLTLPILFLGVTLTIYLWYVIHSALGFMCMWYFARDEVKLSQKATLVASVAWAYGGFHQSHYSGGHFVFVPFLYFPLAFLLWRRAQTDLRYAIGLGWLVAWMFHEGAVYPLPHLLVFLFVETLTRLNRKSFVPIARAGVVVLACGLTVGASRFLPVMDQLKAHTRPIGAENDHIQWQTLKDMFLARTHERHVAGQSYVWPEYSTYMGPCLLFLALLGVVAAAFEAPWLLLLAGVAFVLMMGHFSPLAPWAVLKKNVFPFKEMRVPSRFRCEVSMFIALFAGLATDRIPKRLAAFSRKGAEQLRFALLAIALVGAGDMLATGNFLFQGAFTNPPEVKVAASPRLFVHGPNLASLIDQPRQNRMRLACWDEWGFSAGAPMWDGDVPQARPAPGQDAIVEVANRTQNKFSLEIVANAPARILINSGYDRGWRTNVGTLSDQEKLLVLDVPAGRHTVKLEYWPHGLTLGFVLAFVGLVGSIAAFVKLSRKKSASSPVESQGS